MNNGRLPQILITNDDGISAKGIAALIEVAKPFGQIYVLAPDKPQSGMGHAITIHDPIRMFKAIGPIGMRLLADANAVDGG